MITVITPTIPGREDVLRECEESVAALGLRHLIELDSTGEGPSVVRNRLIEKVETEWVVCLDDDDLLFLNYVDAVTPHLSDADVVYTGWQLSGANGPYPISGFDANRLRGENFIPVTACVRTEAIRAIGGFTSVRYEDHALWVALLDAGFRFIYTPVIAWHYR